MELGKSPSPVRTKIIATVGPASESPETLRNLVLAGASIFRLNMAHGSLAWHQTMLDRIRATEKELGRPLGVWADLSGPKIRLGALVGGEITCEKGTSFEMALDANPNDPHWLTTTYPPLIEALKVGARVLLADGTVGMRVVSKQDGVATLVVEQPGVIRSGQGVNVPGLQLKIPALTEQDRRHIDWLADRGLDFVGLSFVGAPEDVVELRRLLDERHCTAQVLSKIERAEALDQLDAIIEVSEAVLVARGDLGVEIELSRVPVAQKRIIAACNRRGVPVITGTQMLETMRYSSRPTRAEASDVANAILDESDALLLSGETAAGQFPVEAVDTMRRIAWETEQILRGRPRPDLVNWTASTLVRPVTEAMVRAAAEAAGVLHPKMVFVVTGTGRTALALAKQRTFEQVLATSPNEATLRRMALYWGVIPVRLPVGGDRELLIAEVTGWGRQQGLLRTGDYILLLSSAFGEQASHDLLLTHEVP